MGRGAAGKVLLGVAVLNLTGACSESTLDTTGLSATTVTVSERTALRCSQPSHTQIDGAPQPDGPDDPLEAATEWRAHLHSSASWDFPEADAPIEDWQAAGGDRGWHHRPLDESTSELVYVFDGAPVLVATFARRGPDAWLIDAVGMCGELMEAAGFVRTEPSPL